MFQAVQKVVPSVGTHHAIRVFYPIEDGGLGFYPESTRDLLGSWKAVAQDFSFIYDLYNNGQMRLRRAQHEMVKFVENKSKLMEAKKRWEGTVR
jgi:hypothetical protein